MLRLHATQTADQNDISSRQAPPGLAHLCTALTHTRRMLSEGRSNGRQALLQEICRIAVENGHFQRAAIGMIENQCTLVEVASFSSLQETPGRHAGKTAASFPFPLPGPIDGALVLHSSDPHIFDAGGLGFIGDIASEVAALIDGYEDAFANRQQGQDSGDNENFTSAVLTAALDCIVSVNARGEIISFNQAAESTFGYSAAEVMGKQLADIMMPPDFRENHAAGLERILAIGENAALLNRRFELAAIRSDGTAFPVELALVPVDLGEQLIFTAFIRDITELKRSQAALKDHAARYRHLIDQSPEAIIVCSGSELALLNTAACRLLGVVNPQQLRGRNIFSFIHPDYHGYLHSTLGAQMAPAVPKFVEQIWNRLDGSKFNAEIGTTPLLHNGSAATQIVVRDITERKRAESLQLGQNFILNLLATGVPLPEILSEIAQFIERQSDRGLCAILQLDETGKELSCIAAPSLPEPFVAGIGRTAIGPLNGSCGAAAHRLAPVIATDIANDPLWSSQRGLALQHGLHACTSWPIFGRNRKLLGTFALYFKDYGAPTSAELQLFSVCTKLAGIAIERRASEEQIRFLAHYDGLTSLPNRFLFKEFLDLALRNAQRHGNKFAVFFLDLDKFKEINDRLGHDAGDLVLHEIAGRLRKTLRHTDKIARMGGDEFYVLIEELSDGRYAADVAQKLLEEAARPVKVGDQECSLSASIGISIFPDDGNDAATLLKNADAAMYHAKDCGKNRFHFRSMPDLLDAPPALGHMSRMHGLAKNMQGRH